MWPDVASSTADEMTSPSRSESAALGPAPALGGALEGYDPGDDFCEMLGSAANPATHTTEIRARLEALDIASLRQRARNAERELYNLGITFTVYAERDVIDRILPFDVIPRVLSRDEWAQIDRGVKQRVAALNLFLNDVYGPQLILKDGIVPAALILENDQYQPLMHGVKPRHGSFVNICGTDIVRNHRGDFLVLEDNARTPSGVSYVIENRQMMTRAFPDLLVDTRIRRVGDYGVRLAEALAEMAPESVLDPQVAVMSPGVYNAAYFEHVFLAREIGAPLVEGRDLFVEDDAVFMRTTGGPVRVDVIYRRINDDFMDPEALNPKSMLGVPGLIRAYARGNVSLANALGNGVGDDKATYAYMPRIIKYYLDEEPILPNVETHVCREPDGLAYTLDRLSELVVKPVGSSGGYGITVGPLASKRQLAECRKALKADPANYIAQPMVHLSVCPTLARTHVAPRRVDLRPFAITGKDTWVLPGGLTRVALKKGSIIVNSSQGGGSKDTWVLE